MRLERRYEAEAAHRLTAGVPDGHPCKRQHGHRYIIIVTLIGDVDPATGMMMEYAQVDERVKRVLDHVDHRDLNLLGAVNDGSLYPLFETVLAETVRKNPTVENLVTWFHAELKQHFVENRSLSAPLLRVVPVQAYAVRIEEDSRSAVES